MESKLIPTLQVGNGYTYLKLRGVLDEDNPLANLLSQIQGRLLLIDMAEMERINSCGVRDWVNWLNQIQALGLQVILLRCHPSVVAQANMVTNFAAEAFIHSFFAPYVHPETGEEQNVLLFTEELRQSRPIKAPTIFDNGEELEFDEFEESYFAFVSDPRMMNYQIPADIQDVIQFFMPEAVSRQPVIQSKTSTQSATSLPGMSSVPMQPKAGPAAMSGMQAPIGGYGSNPAAMGNYGMGAQPQRPPYGNVSSPSGAGMYGQNNNYYGQNNVSGMQQTVQPQNFNRPMPSQQLASIPNQQMAMQNQQMAMQNQQMAMQNQQMAMQNQQMAMQNQQRGAMPNQQMPGVPLPTPSAPVRHEQPPLPSNQGYQQLQSPQQAAPAPAQPQMAAAPMQQAPVQNDIAPAQPAHVNAARSNETMIQNRPSGSALNPVKNTTIAGIPKKTFVIAIAGIAVLIVVLLIFIIIKLATK